VAELESFGQYIRSLRMAMGIGQKEFAALAKLNPLDARDRGLDRSAISVIEQNRLKRGSERIFKRLATVAGTSWQELKKKFSPPSITIPFVDYLKEKQLDPKFTRAALAEATGRTQEYIGHLARGHISGLQWDMVEPLSRLFNVEPETLLPYLSAHQHEPLPEAWRPKRPPKIATKRISSPRGPYAKGQRSYTRFGMLIFEDRKRKGLTQTQYANLLGAPVLYVSMIENGIRYPSEKNLSALAERTGIPLVQLKEHWVKPERKKKQKPKSQPKPQSKPKPPDRRLLIHQALKRRLQARVALLE
jgi:transcriptional regulator with XRE-family HTH domain